MLHEPQNHKDRLQEILAYVKKSGGYIGKGPFYVSKLSPGMAELLRLLSIRAGIAEETLPSDVRYGFSTIEFDAIAAKRGYTSHLNGMILWIELELLFGNRKQTRTITEFLDRVFGRLVDHSFERQRLQWISSKLAKLDPQNMFFRWIQLQAAMLLLLK